MQFLDIIYETCTNTPKPYGVECFSIRTMPFMHMKLDARGFIKRMTYLLFSVRPHFHNTTLESLGRFLNQLKLRNDQ